MGRGRPETLFSEQQRFRQVWLWALLIFINGLYVNRLVNQASLGGSPLFSREVAIESSILFLATLLFLFLRLDTQITREGIFYRFRPVQWKYKKIAWQRVSKSYVRQYLPLTEFGGWGIRFGFGTGRAYNVSGNQGLQIVYDNGKRFLLGTKRPKEMEQALRELGRVGADG